MRNRKWLHVSMVLVLLLSFLSPLTISKTQAQNKLSQLSLTESENGITLTWEASLPQNEEIINYQLIKNGQTTKIEPSVQTKDETIKQYSYEDTNIISNTTYTYEVTALTSSGNLLTSEKVEYLSEETTPEGDQSEEIEEGQGEANEETENQVEADASEVTEPQEPTEASETTVPASSNETVVTNVKVSTTKGNIPYDFDYSIIGVSENVAEIEYYGFLDEEGFFNDYDSESKNLELPVGTYELVTFNYSTEEEITAEFEVENDRDYQANPIEILLDDDQLIIKKVLSVEGVTEQSISIYWEEPWEPEDIKKYQVYLNDTMVEEITDPYATAYTYTDLLQETTYQVKVDIFYKDGTVETIETEAKTTAPPVGEKVQFKDENLKMAVVEALKVYHRDIYIDDMERLTSLDAGYLEIKDLTGIESATNLVDLTLSGNEIKDLTPIKNLINLSFLDLDENQISTIKNLANLKSLDTVFLAYNDLDEIDTLLELPNLTHVTVYGNYGLDLSKGSSDMAVIQKLQERDVYIEWSDIEHEIVVTDVTESTVEFDINFFEVVENIKKYLVYVNGEEVGETPVSKPFYKLTGLDPLSEIDITVEGVDEDGFVWGSAYAYVKTPPTPSGKSVQFNDPALEEAIKEALHINSREIVESDLSILTALDASERGITDLKGLEFATNLEELHLDSNAISSLKPLKGLTELTYLSLAENEIVDISPLKNLTNLEFLGLDGNEIVDIGVLSSFTNLSYLTLQRNKIKDITSLENLNIEILDLSYNEISDISSLLKLENLLLVMLLKNPLDLTEGSRTLAIIHELEEKEVLVLYEYLDISVDNVSDSEIELSWEPVTSDGFEDFTYSVFVDGEVVEEEMKETTYLFSDLEPETEYTIEIIGFDENNEERFIYGTTKVTTSAMVEEPGDETDPEEGEAPSTPVEQPADDKDEVTTPGKEINKDDKPKQTNNKSDKKNDDKKLPKTATNNYNILLVGLLLLGVGITAFFATRKKTA
ncbi:leucine-rich repeat domain-containing protein [Bacillus timonensis]|uniref:leucine-rich repeat domain-containing protein n=1 Tax=Bacillus timonensis TaxID=1033734 RepID=UPI0002882DD8|nr:leucine-rich repeat domain-containing protein [Bacillus timonensis]